MRKVHNNLLILRYLGLFILCSLGSSANATDWAPTLVAAKNADFRETDEAFRIHIPPEVSLAELQNLALELDNIDITAMVQREGEYAVYQPAQALVPGSHLLRVVEYTQDNGVIELGAWRVEVRQTKLFQSYALAANSQLTVSQRIADNNLASPTPSRLQGQGSAQVGYTAANGDWHTAGQFDLLYNSLNDNQTGRKVLDTGEFLFSAGNSFAEARVGHQTVGSASLIMNNFRRRGMSLEGRIPTLNSSLSGFSLSSEDVIGFRRGLGIGDSQQRVDGITFDTNPISNKPQALHLSGTWLNGKGRDTTGLVASIDRPDLTGATFLLGDHAKGSAWAINADSQLLDNRLQLRAEYAQSDYDFNTVDNLSSENDKAYSLMAMFSDNTAAGLNWNIGVENSRVGTFFKSLANQALPSDQWLLRIFSGAQWSTFGLQAGYQKLEDNVNDIAELPRIETDLSSIGLNWNPTMASADGWLGTPSLKLVYSRQTQDQTFTPVGFLQAKTDNNLDSWQANALFSYPSANWGLGLVHNKFRDHATIQHDTDSNGVNLSGNLIVMDRRLSLAPSINFNRTEDLISNQDSTAITYALQTVMVFQPDKLDGSLDISFNDNYTSDNAIDNNTLAINLALNWHIVKAQRNNLGFDLGLSGMYNDLNDKVTVNNSLETYQVFFTLSAVLPSRVGQAQ